MNISTRLSNEEVLERYRSSAAFEAMLVSEEARIETARAGAIAAIEHASRERAKQRPALVQKFETATQAVRAAEDALRARALEAAAVRGELFTLDCAYARELLRRENQLRQSAPVEIAETRRGLDEDIRRGRRAFVEETIIPRAHTSSEPKRTVTRSNVVLVSTLLRAAYAAVKRCDELLTAPLTRAAIRAELAGIRPSIPPIESTRYMESSNLSSRPTPDPMRERPRRGLQASN